MEKKKGRDRAPLLSVRPAERREREKKKRVRDKRAGGGETAVEGEKLRETECAARNEKGYGRGREREREREGETVVGLTGGEEEGEGHATRGESRRNLATSTPTLANQPLYQPFHSATAFRRDHFGLSILSSASFLLFSFSSIFASFIITPLSLKLHVTEYIIAARAGKLSEEICLSGW